MRKEKIKWVKIFERRAEALIIFSAAIGRKWYPETLKINFRPKNIKYEDGWYYFDAKEIKQEVLVYRKIYETNPQLFKHLANRIYKKAKELVVVAEKNSKGLKKKNSNELGKSFERYNNALEKFMPAAWSFIVIEKFLTEQLKNQLKKRFPRLNEETLNKYFNILTTLPAKSSAGLEYQALLTVAEEYKKDGLTESVNKKIKQIYNKFHYLGAVRVGLSYLAKSYDFEHYKTIIKDLANGNPEKELKELRRKKVENQKDYRNFIKNKNIDKKLIRSAETLQEYIFLRTARGEYMVQSMLYIQGLLDEIAYRLNLGLEDIAWMIPTEVIEALKTKKIPDVSQRKKTFAFTVIGGKSNITIEHRPKKKKHGINLRTFKGNPAYPGVVRGKVKLIKSNKDIGKMKKGDILVTSMTRPDMTIAIHKSGAVITDEGGITCHASIVSREFKIPCIIGTKIATKVLQDGDLVEVDAEKGIVKILKKNKK